MIHLRDKLAQLYDIRERTTCPRKRNYVNLKMFDIIKQIRKEREYGTIGATPKDTRRSGKDVP